MGGKKKKPGKKSSKKSGNAAETGSQKSRSEICPSQSASSAYSHESVHKPGDEGGGGGEIGG